ncbi:MAG: DUF2076 domain-containing protein [Alphaproteobacteria bacterium]|nr:DUF2076 domain-containing protein [Alphaproteobacteria bacterium]
MTPQERELIDGLFQRLKAADTPQKDREAEDLINKRTVEVPATPYLLVQTALVQEHALAAAQQRISQLEKEVEAAKAQAPAAGASTSFLGGLLGGNRWNQGGAAPSSSQPRSSVPITAPAGTPQPSYAAAAAPSGGGFLQSALTTAAGVAGGALLFDGISSLLFHHQGPFSPYVGAGYGGSPWGGGGGNVYETTVNNYGSQQPNQNVPDSNADDSDIRDASYDPSESDQGDFDDGSGGDFGGGNDDTSV